MAAKKSDKDDPLAEARAAVQAAADVLGAERAARILAEFDTAAELAERAP